jgi:NADH-quinone oxidoreductase subunit C
VTSTTLSAENVTAAFAADGIEVKVTEFLGELCAEVPATSWVAAITSARDGLSLTYFDWLSAVDNRDEGFAVVCHVFRSSDAARLLIQARIAAEEPAISSITDVYRGAAWHERETHEMFGIDFVGHPYLVPLLLPEEFDGHPLRKDFVLASRAAKPWPGAKEPGESEASGSPSRRKTLPPGVPDPQTWGPRPASGATQ